MNAHASDDHATVDELLAAWALDAVDDLERARVERHLRACGECRAQADQLLATAAALADELPAVPPRAGLRDDVLALIEATPQEELPASTDMAERTAGAATHDRVGAPTGGATRRGHRRDRLGWRMAVVGAAAAAVLGLAGTVAFLELGSRIGALEDDVESALALAAEDSTRTWEAAADDVRLRVLAGDDGAYVLSDGLATLDEGSWVLWGIEDGTPVQLGMLGPGRDAVALAASPATLDAVAVSFEQDPTTPVPTTDPVIVVALTDVSG